MAELPIFGTHHSGSSTSATHDNYDALKKVPGAIVGIPQNEFEVWSKHLERFIDTRYESDTCAFCGAHIDPETAYHKSICRRCV